MGVSSVLWEQYSRAMLEVNWEKRLKCLAKLYPSFEAVCGSVCWYVFGCTTDESIFTELMECIDSDALDSREISPTEIFPNELFLECERWEMAPRELLRE